MKIKNKDGLFFVAEKNQYIIATVMAGYDGHRGWIYSIAVHPDYRKQGIGSDLLTFIQGKLTSLGCLKVNLQIMEGNEAVQKFYKANGFSVEQRVSMGKKLY
jgi:ribosomal protein S18 acetylase RimI-like enzyme